MFLFSLLRSPSVAIFESHAEWEERMEGGHGDRDRRGHRTEGLVEREETKLEPGEPCLLRVVRAGRWSLGLAG